MPDLFKAAARWLSAKQKDHTSTLVTYSRVEASVEVRAVIGRSQWDVPDASGLLLRVESRDYLIETDDLELDGQIAEPKPGDRIVEPGGGDDGSDLIYEVSAPAPGLSHWQWDGPHRVRRRIHTKKIGAVP